MGGSEREIERGLSEREGKNYSYFNTNFPVTYGNGLVVEWWRKKDVVRGQAN